MAVSSIVDFVEEVLRLQLLTGPQRTELQTDLAPRLADAKALAAELMKRGWLTPYQANLIFPGRTAELLIGPYVLMQRIGEGGMGKVYKALHTVLRRTDAVKVMHDPGAGAGEAVLRFLQEAVASGKVAHPNLVAVHTADRVGGGFYLAMEYIDGTDLGKLIQSRPAGLPVGEACEYIRQASLGLAHAHERDLVHRDVKPSNLMLRRDGVVKVLDLGLARVRNEVTDTRLTRPGSVMGTPDYMSPEQINDSQTADARSDIYSLGCTLYHLLTGSPPYPQGTWMEKLRRHCEGDPEPIRKRRPDVPPEVINVVRRMMEREVSLRYQTAAEVAEGLSRFGTSGDNARPPTAILVNPPVLPSMPPASISDQPTATDKGLLTSGVSPDATPIVPLKRRRLGPRLLLGAGLGMAAVVALFVLSRGLLDGDPPITAAPAPPAEPGLIVDPSGNGDFRTILEATSQAPEGSRIRIKPGVYQESIVIHKALELVGDGTPEEVVIRSGRGECIIVVSQGVVVRRLTVRCEHTPEQTQHAVEVSAGHLLMEDCIVTGNSVTPIYIHGGEGLRATLRRCRVPSEAGGAVLVRENAEVLLEACDLQGKSHASLESQSSAVVTCRDSTLHGTMAAGALAIQDSGMTLERCTIRGNASTGMFVAERAEVRLIRCTMTGNGLHGMYTESARESLLDDCDLFGNGEVEMKIAKEGNARLTGCRLYDGTTGLLSDRKGSVTLQDCEFRGHTKAEVSALNESLVKMERCRVLTGKGVGVLSFARAEIRLEECEVSARDSDCVTADPGGRLHLKLCKIHDGQRAGVSVNIGGEVTLEQCEVYGHLLVGGVIFQGGKMIVRGGKVVRNGEKGFQVDAMAELDISDCDLRDNVHGAWRADKAAKITKRNVIEPPPN